MPSPSVHGLRSRKAFRPPGCGLLDPTEGEEVESRHPVSGHGRETVRDLSNQLVGTHVAEQPCDGPGAVTQHPERGTDPAGEGKPDERRQMGRTGDADADGRDNTGVAHLGEPGEDRPRIEGKLGDDEEVDAGRPRERLLGREGGDSSGTGIDGCPSGCPAMPIARMPFLSNVPVASRSADDANGPFGAGRSPAMRSMRVTAASPAARFTKSSSAPWFSRLRAATCGTGSKPPRRSAVAVAISGR